MKEIGSVPSILGKLFGDLDYVKLPVAIFGAALGYALPTEAIQRAASASVFLILLDTATGVVAAGMSGKAISSARFGRVLVKIFAYASVVAVVSVVTKTVPGVDGTQPATVTGILTFIVLTEGVSILENVRLMGFELPFGLEKWFRERLRQATDEPEVSKP